MIELLKKSHPTSNEIQEYINEKLTDPNSSKKGSGYFTLKNEGDFTSFFPLIHVNDRMKLLANYSEKLIKMNTKKPFILILIKKLIPILSIFMFLLKFF